MGECSFNRCCILLLIVLSAGMHSVESRSVVLEIAGCLAGLAMAGIIVDCFSLFLEQELDILCRSVDIV